jgi:YgiT-type zinc finger domain-containing protein
MNKKTVKSRKKRNPVYECEYCGACAARKVKLNHTFGRFPKLIVVSNVETMVCDNCGQSYLEGPALEIVGQILAAPATHTQMRSVAVAVL